MACSLTEVWLGPNPIDFTPDPPPPCSDLETLMRATLGAMANFNEDEKMILLKCVMYYV